MAVIVKYVVVRNGKEEMMFSTKKEADAYDKMLDIAERLYNFLQASKLGIDDDQLDTLTFFMAQHHDQLSRLLKGGKLEPPASGLTAEPTSDTKAIRPETSVAGNRETTKRTRPTKTKAVA